MNAWIRLVDAICCTSLRPGEKLYEKLLIDAMEALNSLTSRTAALGVLAQLVPEWRQILNQHLALVWVAWLLVPQPQPDLIVVLDGGPVLLAELILAIHGIGVLPVDPPTPPRAKQLVPAEVPRKCQACGV